MNRRRVLMIVFQFPPFAGSSAVQRSLRFVRYLPEFGWDPVVLTADPRAYEQQALDLVGDVPSTVPVCRAFALDAKRHLSVFGRHPAFLAHPDRWRTWQWSGVRAAMRLVAEHAPAAIWSTYPIVSAHDIGLKVARATGLPWIADFRDPMVEEEFPEDPVVRADFARRECEYSHVARCFTVTTPGMRDWFAERYPQRGTDGVELIENGYDEEAFASATPTATRLNPRAITLLHSGELYAGIRDPSSLFEATRSLVDSGDAGADRLRFRFRGSGDDQLVLEPARRFGLVDRVQVLPRVAYREALAEMMAADGLVILQGADCNRQIPAKVYEYMRTGKPLLGVTDPRGDTGRVLLGAGCDCIAALDDVPAVTAALRRFLLGLDAGTPSVARAEVVAASSRRARAHSLANLLARVSPAGAG